MAKKKKGRRQYKSGPKKGQFMSARAISAKRAASKRKSKPKRKSTALAKRGKTTSMAKKKKRKNRRRGNPNGRGLIADRDLMIGGAIYGFISKTAPEPESISATFQEQVAKLPEIGNADITNGLLLYFIDRYVWKNKWIRDTSRAALVTGAVRFGRRNFTLGEGDGTGYEDALDVTEEGGKLSGIVD